MNRQQLLDYYSREDIIEQLLKNAKDREVAGAFFDGTYDQRPNILQYHDDVIQMVKKGVTSFHFSVERWKRPMQLTAKNYEQLRKGFDLIIDIDSKLGLDEAKLAAVLVCKLLEKYSIKNYSIKFSGRRGFHICLPWESFPNDINYKPLASMYPEIPRIIAGFIRKEIENELIKELVKKKSAKELIAILEEPPEKLDPFYFVEIEKNWGNRHMFRAPYSLNEKTWLVSMPINIDQLDKFTPDMAEPSKLPPVPAKYEFFHGEKNEAINLLTAAMDWDTSIKKEAVRKPAPSKINWEKKIPEDLFPPCLKLILGGLSDGRKRSIFTLASFLRMMNWSQPEIESKIFEWNEKNKSTLPTSILKSQLRWNQQNQRTPSNCDNDQFYSSIGVCRPDETCKAGGKINITNPINYPFRKMKRSAKKREIKKGYGMYECSVCKKSFPTIRSLKLHKARMHGQQN